MGELKNTLCASPPGWPSVSVSTLFNMVAPPFKVQSAPLTLKSGSSSTTNCPTLLTATYEWRGLPNLYHTQHGSKPRNSPANGCKRRRCYCNLNVKNWRGVLVFMVLVKLR
jgi:hypothetical protein